MAMGKGIAIHFKSRFGQIEKLKEQNVKTGGVAFLCDKGRYVYYLVTKAKYWKKPTYSTVKQSLQAMCAHMLQHGQTSLWMPRIGSGLDGLHWKKVLEMIEDVFQHTNIQVTIVEWTGADDKKAAKSSDEENPSVLHKCKRSDCLFLQYDATVPYCCYSCGQNKDHGAKCRKTASSSSSPALSASFSSFSSSLPVARSAGKVERHVKRAKTNEARSSWHQPGQSSSPSLSSSSPSSPSSSSSFSSSPTFFSSSTTTTTISTIPTPTATTTTTTTTATTTSMTAAVATTVTTTTTTTTATSSSSPSVKRTLTALWGIKSSPPSSAVAPPSTSFATASSVLASSFSSSATSLAPSRAEGEINSNQALAEILTEMGNAEKIAGQVFKARAYYKAVKSIKQHDARIRSGREASKLEGVGKKLAAKIQEILDTGKLDAYEKKKEDPKLMAAVLFGKIPGIGPVKAQQLVQTHGILSLEELRSKRHQVGLTHYAKVGLDLYEELSQKIPRAEVDEIFAALASIAQEVDPFLELTVCGSYRRGAAMSGDIDVLITHPTWTQMLIQGQSQAERVCDPALTNRLIAKLQDRGLVTHNLGSGKSKFSGVCRLPECLHRRLDLRFIPYPQRATATLYFTGSDTLNTKMRVKAREVGLHLSEYGVHKLDPDTGEKLAALPVETEEDIFRIIKMDFLPPTQRNV
eukprot:gb/GEZN01002818.1/.p1 GENE.gb/GEZN01002818.1/~~gb/GEZN01002818.1/.p1  ORF type:complete len:763 (-),score=186.35 gb/GEZN01002818.1/:67-2139(-)